MTSSSFNNAQNEMEVVLECNVDPNLEGYGLKRQKVGGIDWFATWNMTRTGNKRGIAFEIGSGPINGQNLNVKISFSADKVCFSKPISHSNSTVFGGDRRSVRFEAFVVTDQPSESSVEVPDFTTFIVLKVSRTASSAYEFNEQRWPMTFNYILYGADFAIRMDVAMLKQMNSNWEGLKSDFSAKDFPANEKEAFFDFCGTLMQGWNAQPDKFLVAIQNGIKFGFTRIEGLEEYIDKWDFVSRTALCSFPAIAQNPIASEVVDPRTRNEFCELKFIGGHPIRQFWKTATDGFELFAYMTPTKSGKSLLMVSAIFNCARGPLAHFEAMVTVSLVDGKEVLVQHSAKRIIHSRQKTITFVIGEYDWQALEDGDAVCNVVVKKLQSNQWKLDNVINIGQVDHEKPHGAENMVLAMPGHVDGFIECRDKKLIAVNREFLRVHSEYLDAFWKPEGNISGDVTNKIAKIPDWDSDLVYKIMEILYHRTHQINDPQNISDYLYCGQFFLSPFIMHYLEIALLFCNDFDLSDKLNIANHFNFEITKFINDYPQYATDVHLLPIINVNSKEDDLAQEAWLASVRVPVIVVDAKGNAREAVHQPAVDPDNMGNAAGEEEPSTLRRSSRKRRAVDDSQGSSSGSGPDRRDRDRRGAGQ